MKKLLLVILTLLALGFVASQALACIWGGYGWGPMGRSWGGYYPGRNPGPSYQSFLDDTAGLRQELAAKQGEYSALMAQPNPDPQRAAQLSKEIAALHEQLQVKAQAHGLGRPRPYRGPMGPYCYGPRHGGWGRW